MIYFQKGIELFLDHPLVVLLAALFIFFVEINTIFTHTIPSLGLLSLLILLIQTAFGLSVPALLKKSKSDMHIIVTTTVKSLKRVILPLLILVVIVITAIILLAMLYVFIFHGTSHFSPSWGLQILLSVINVIGAALFIFVPTYFSVLQKKYFSSLLLSFKFSLSHLSFYVTLVIIGIPVALLGYIINSNYGAIAPIGILVAVFESLFWTFISGVAFLYLEDHLNHAEQVTERSALNRA